MSHGCILFFDYYYFTLYFSHFAGSENRDDVINHVRLKIRRPNTVVVDSYLRHSDEEIRRRNSFVGEFGADPFSYDCRFRANSIVSYEHAESSVTSMVRSYKMTEITCVIFHWKCEHRNVDKSSIEHELEIKNYFFKYTTR